MHSAPNRAKNPGRRVQQRAYREEEPAGKSLAFDSKTEDIRDEAGEVCGQRTTLYNLECHNSFSREATTLDWRVPLDEEYWEVVVELEDGTLRASTGE